MTKEITKAFVLQQLTDKFKLREWIPEKFTFSEEVIPVYDLAGHFIKWKCDHVDVSVTGIGAKLFYTVPGNERWHLDRYVVTFMAGGAYKVSGAYTVRKDYPTDYIYMDLTLNQTMSYAVFLPRPVILNSGDAVYINVDNYTSTADLRLYIDYQVEEIR